LLKRISTTDLRVGMFVDEFCGSWMDHPFWRARFVVKSETELGQIRNSGIREIWIDSSKGLDVEPSAKAVQDRAQTETQVEKQLRTVAADTPARLQRKGDLLGEVERASKIFKTSRKVVADMFGQARLGQVHSLAQASDVVEDISESVKRHPSAMIGLARLKSADNYTFMHSMAVSALMIALARAMGLGEEEVKVAGMAGLLHDVGKAQIPLSVLNKPDTLNDEEWRLMRSHPGRGHAMLQDTQGITDPVLDAVLHHHEKIDGSGYPDNLTGDRISELSKMTALCDVYDAVTSDRAYKAGLQPTIAVRKMAEWSGHFDPAIFKAFIKAVGIYPVGSLVQLKSQRLAVVVDHDPANLLQPTVKAFFSLRSKMHIEPVVVHLSKERNGERIVSYEDPAAHGVLHTRDLWVPPHAMATV
jgi:putative nucleotidyltransferase with HDIG domain